MLKDFKYARRTGSAGWAPILGRAIVGWLEKHVDPDRYDVICGNPTHPSRPVRHTEMILDAAIVQDISGVWPIDPRLLEKTQETTQAAGGNWHQKKARAEELYRAVRLRPGASVDGESVLVFDDITTSLHQLHVLGRILRSAGAASVEALVIARAVRR